MERLDNTPKHSQGWRAANGVKDWGKFIEHWFYVIGIAAAVLFVLARVINN